MQEVEQAAVARGPDLALLVPVPVRAAVPRVEARQPHDRAARGQRGPLRAQELARARACRASRPPRRRRRPRPRRRRRPTTPSGTRRSRPSTCGRPPSPRPRTPRRRTRSAARRRGRSRTSRASRARARRRRRAQALELGVRRRRRRLADDPRAGVRLAPQAARRSPQHAAADDVQRRRRRRGQGVGTGHDEEDVVHRCTDLHNALACTKNFWKLTS